MAEKSTFSILPNALVYWENNHAAVFGGAIDVSDYSPFSYCVSSDNPGLYIAKEECFFQPNGQNLSSGFDAQLIFKNNSAGVAGNVLFGGVVDNCQLTGLYSNDLVKCLTCLLTLMTIQTQTFHPTHFTFVYVKTIFQTVVSLLTMFHTLYILGRCFKFLW